VLSPQKCIFFYHAFGLDGNDRTVSECDCGIFSPISGICFSIVLLDSHQHCLRVCTEKPELLPSM
jgi:hypothetical protein